MKDTNGKFQYNNQFLERLIVATLTDLKFLLRCIDLEVSQYIESEPHKWMVDFTINFYKEYRVIPSMQSIQLKIEQQKQPLFKQSLSKTFIAVLNAFEEENLQFIKDTVINFCRFQQLKKAIMKSIDLLKLQDYQEIYDLINQTRFKGIDSNLGIQYVDSFLERYSKKQTHTTVETPWTILNNILKGGSISSRLHLIVAPPGIGKSWFLCNLASHALKCNKKVVYYALQMEEWEIAERIDILLLGKTPQQIKLNPVKYREEIQKYKSNLQIKEFLPKVSKLVQIENHVKQLQLFANFIPDLIIVDHGDNLKLPTNIGSNMYSLYGANFVGMKAIAKSLKIPVWSASQGKRGTQTKQYIFEEDTSHSMQKIEIADFAISLSMSHEDKLTGTCRWAIIKNRHGRSGMVYNGIVDFERGEMNIFDSHTKQSAEARERMDNGNTLVKARVSQRLLNAKRNKNKQKEQTGDFNEIN